jgi:hypothetical protein
MGRSLHHLPQAHALAVARAVEEVHREEHPWMDGLEAAAMEVVVPRGEL